MGLEHLLFEELVLSTGVNLSPAEYERCLRNKTKLGKLIRQLSPHHRKAQDFTAIVAEIEAGGPPLLFWEPKEIERAWGVLSQYLHWAGAKTETTDSAEWMSTAYAMIDKTITPLWAKMGSGYSALLHHRGMPEHVRLIWEDFAAEKIDGNSVKARLRIVRPLYAS